MKKRFLFLALAGTALFMFACSTIPEKETVPVSISIGKPGIYSFTITGERSTPNTTAGTTLVVDDIRLVEETRIIKIETGKQFGFMVEVKNSGKNEIEVEKKLIHPEFFDPYLKINTSVSSSKFAVKDGSSRFWGYKLEEEFEMVPGIWRFEVWYQGKLYAYQEFELTK